MIGCYLNIVLLALCIVTAIAIRYKSLWYRSLIDYAIECRGVFVKALSELNKVWAVCYFCCARMRSRFRKYIRNSSAYNIKGKIDVYYKDGYSRFCIAIFLYFFIYTIYLDREDIGMIALMGGGYLLCAAILIHNAVLKKTSKHRFFKWLWYVALTVCFPTVASYSLLCNDHEVILVSNAVLSIITLMFFADASAFIVCSIAGFVFGAGAYHYFHGLSSSHVICNFCYIIVVVTAAWLFLMKPREKIIKDEFDRIYIMAGSMAHEVKSPLATSYSYAEVVSNLIASGEMLDDEKDEVSIKYSRNNYNSLREFSSLAVDVALCGIKAVDAILLNIKQDIGDAELTKISVSECLISAINSYASIHRGVVERISINIDQELNMMGVALYMESVLYNLIKNSFRHGGSNVRVAIYNEGSSLIISDDGRGISPEELPFIFDIFYTKNYGGNGIGLAFCKMAMKAFGGDVVCESEQHKYTKFILTLPLSREG